MTTTIGTAATRAEDELEARLPSVLAVVVTHRGRPWLGRCLTALAVQSYPLLDVLVVDDASPDSRSQPALKRVAKRHLRRRRWGYLRTARPLGFGGAINWALGRIRTDADLLLFVHDDAVLERDSVEHMVARIYADEVTAIVGPKVVAWDDPGRLEEVGMAIDRFGYPYKGLEEGEIDLGQHDRATEVFYVTSTCMLVRHEVFKRLRGWDARMRAYSEDLDLCWRARLQGYAVKVEPAARVRHAIALATGERTSPFRPARYFIRRNRLRTVLKNASGPRLVALIPLFVLLALAEMLGFVVLRQPREILNLARALLWNAGRLPQTLAERARVQSRRRVSDRRLKRLMVRETTRLRSYAGQQAERLEAAWGRRAELAERRLGQLRSLVARLRGLAGVAAFGALAAVLLGLRHFLWAPSAALGELLPFPDGALSLLRSFVSPWQPAGLGASAPGPPAHALLGLVSIASFGDAGAAQKLTVLGLGVLALVGAYRLVADVVDRPARWAAGAVYVLGGVGYAGLRDGRLGTLVFGAAAPYALTAMARLTGWVRPPGWSRGRTLAVLILAAAVSAAFVPGSLVLYALCAVVLALCRRLLQGRARGGLASCVVALVAAWALLLPWSATWTSAGGPLARLLSTATRPSYAATFAGQGVLSAVLGQLPEAPALFGLALPVMGLVAVLTGLGLRRRLALALWAIVAATGWYVALVASGRLPPLVASPSEAGVPVALAFAALAGLAVGAFRVDLPARGLGWVHAATLGALAVALALFTAGVLPALGRGAWAPGRGMRVEPAQTFAQIASVLSVEAAERGDFRVLWVGRGWRERDPSAARPLASTFLSGPAGPQITDLFVRDGGEPYTELGRVVASVEEGATDRGGRLLGAFNVAFVVLDRADDIGPWLDQRDLALVRTEPGFFILENRAALPRAAIYEDLPAYVSAVARTDPSLTSRGAQAPVTALERTGIRSFAVDDGRGPGVLFLAEAAAPGWIASAGDRELDHIEGGWGNAYLLSGAIKGRIQISYPRPLGSAVVLAVQVLAWVVVVGAAFSRRRKGSSGASQSAP